MQSFLASVTNDVASGTYNFLALIISTYWQTILIVLFASFIIGLFWRFARRATGRI